MLLSIVIPAYNVAGYIAGAVRSTLSACTPANLPYEVIVVDDGSTDGTADIIAAMCKSHDNVRSISLKHGGVSQARNAGLDAATGLYVAFLDADDLLDAAGLKSLLETIAAKPHADMIIMNMRTLGKSEHDYDWRQHFSPGRVYGSEALMRTPYYRHSACGIAYRREAIAGVKFDTALPTNEDAIWVSTLFAHGLTAMFVDRDLYLRRLRPESASRTFDAARLASDWLSIERCSALAAASATPLAALVYTRLLYDLAHNLILHAIKGNISAKDTLRRYPVALILRDAPASASIQPKRRLLRLSPRLYAALLRIKGKMS